MGETELLTDDELRELSLRAALWQAYTSSHFGPLGSDPIGDAIEHAQLFRSFVAARGYDPNTFEPLNPSKSDDSMAQNPSAQV